MKLANFASWDIWEKGGVMCIELRARVFLLRNVTSELSKNENQKISNLAS
jgi:hypothetical protein